ncbi:MAG: ABC transporter ATP-binding protein [Firmicutes bacterium]|nr:ABC transporter ATP-binding protein [Bacillota bacterium]
MINVKNLTKNYGNHKAIDDLSFTIEKGNVYGFLGPNGAGKSTTMNIITGCLAASSGQVNIGGFDIFEDAMKAKKLIGYLPEIPPLYPDMKVIDYLKFIAEVKGVAKSGMMEELFDVMEKTQTTDVAGRVIKNLSKGYRQRVGIAQALIGDPEIIILDEPTVGLDPKQIIEIRDLIRELGKEHTVILSSHILSEISAVCNHILIISDGKLVADDTAENLEKTYGMDLETIFLRLTGATDTFAETSAEAVTEEVSEDAGNL